MNLKKLWQSLATKMTMFLIVYLILAGFVYWIVAEDWRKTAVKTDTVSMGRLLPVSSNISQTFVSSMDAIESIAFMPHYDIGNDVTDTVLLSINDGAQVLWETYIEGGKLISDQINEIAVNPCLLDVRGRELTLNIQPNGTNLALWAGEMVSAGKFDVQVETSGLRIDGEEATGQLVMTMSGYASLNGTIYFWPVVLLLAIACIAIIVITHVCTKKNKRTFLTRFIDVCNRYGYLLKQLVWRDFRVKYKASVLGIIWSFLNPLLTMLVYLFVFSTLFRSDIPSFPVYLMSGIVLFNYFSEATGLGLGSIVSNSSLINKVYMPKIIYPLSKVLSSAINLCISFIPLLIVMLLSGVPIYKSMLLTPIVVIFLITFCFGVSLILATMNVFFRDTQFLWGVLITMWNFLTPVFYPESIIPAQFITIYHMNPMYQILFFMRSISINGVSPTPITYLYCLISSVVPLIIGLWVFRKNQDRFVLYL